MKKLINKKNKKNNQDSKKRIILFVIALIIIILALITSCSCTSKFFGKIGSLFVNEGSFLYKEKEGNFCTNHLYCETVINRNLKFDKDVLNITTTDDQPKMTYNYYGIIPKKLTCTTSDARIATCYINSKGYVIINPKEEGTIIVTIETEENDKIYQATATVVVGASKNGIFLQQNKGTINLHYKKDKTVVYSFLNINGKVNVTSSDELVATATASDGLLKITAHKKGNVTITLTVEYNGKTYQVTYNLTVINSVTTEKPNEPTNKDNNSLLSNIKTNKGDVSPVFNELIKDYYINIKESDNDITITATPNSNKSRVFYTYKETTNTTGYFNNLVEGENIVKIIITAEDGTVSVYSVTINKPKTSGGGGGGGTTPPKPLDNNKNLASLSINKGVLSPSFSEDNTKYDLTGIKNEDTSITITATPSSDKSSISYNINGNACNNNICNGLKPGDNIISVIVTAENGTKKVYEIKVFRPYTYAIKIDSKKECHYGDKECKIAYSVINSAGEAIENIDLQKLNITNDIPFNGEISKDKNFIILKPAKEEESLNQKDVTLNISYNIDNNIIENETTVSFKDPYFAEPQVYNYDIYGGEATTAVIETNIFNYDFNDKKEIIDKANGTNPTKKLTLVSKYNDNLTLEIYTESAFIDSISLDDNSLQYLSLNIKANETETKDEEIYIVRKIYGKEIKREVITVNIYNAYKIILQAGKADKDGNIIEGGIFNSSSYVYDFVLSNKAGEKEMNLTQFGIPYKLSDNPCLIYKFNNYYTEGAETKTYTNNITYNDVKDSLIKTIYLMAEYDEETTEKPDEEYTLWAVDIPLFCQKDDEECQKNNPKNKIIYPGANGIYTMRLGNATNKKITVVGMILEEETICVDDINNDGKPDCLNMGYVISAENKVGTEGKYDSKYFYYDKFENDKYTPKLLHKYNELSESESKDSYRNDKNRFIHRTTIKDLDSFEELLSVAPGTKETDKTEALGITIYWEWIDYDDYGTMDKIDTAIGNYAYEVNKNAKDNKTTTINDLYTLKVGLIIKEDGGCKANP